MYLAVGHREEAELSKCVWVHNRASASQPLVLLDGRGASTGVYGVRPEGRINYSVDGHNRSNRSLSAAQTAAIRTGRATLWRVPREAEDCPETVRMAVKAKRNPQEFGLIPACRAGRLRRSRGLIMRNSGSHSKAARRGDEQDGGRLGGEEDRNRFSLSIVANYD